MVMKCVNSSVQSKFFTILIKFFKIKIIENNNFWELKFVTRTSETKLNLANCHLTKCPTWFPLTLKQVHLKNNCLTSLPGCIFSDLPNLVWLDVRNNELTELPPDIQLADKLEDLLLGGNFLKRLPACLAKLKKLNGLQLQPNKHLTSPPIEVVQQGFEVISTALKNQEKIHSRLLLNICENKSTQLLNQKKNWKRKSQKKKLLLHLRQKPHFPAFKCQN